MPAPATEDGLPDLSEGHDFVALPREVDRETAAERRATLVEHGAPQRAQRAAGDRDFYVGIRKDVLEQRWFLSAFLEQYFPGAVNGGAATSLGTRVVSFKTQNGKLFMFDASDRHAATEVFDPEILVEAYPVVDNAYTRSIPFSFLYVFFDPSAGTARFDFLRDSFGSTYWGQIRFDRALGYNQSFERLPDGVAFQQVFAGTADVPISDGVVEPDVFRAAGTLGIALRRYQEGPHYREVALPAQEHYFRSDPKHVIGQPAPVETAAHWDIYPGMQPIEWVISPKLAEVDATPAYADVDLVGAVKTGIESWNAALGFRVFTARLARPDESFGQDDKNYIIFDPDPAVGYAFANWRTNPNTGEIRGASVYFGGVWLDRTGITDDEDEDGLAPIPERPEFGSLRWNGMFAAPLCVRWADEARGALGGPGDDQLTAGQKLERSITDMIAHEIGHDLGLRHNFKGSLVEPLSSSIMDYTIFETSVAMGGTGVGPYDVDAVKYLYGLSPNLPAQPFCTDPRVGKDPLCQRFDFGADPFAAQFQSHYRIIRNWFVLANTAERWLTSLLQYGSKGVYDFSRHGTPEQAQRGLALLLDVGVPVDPTVRAHPSFRPAGADLVFGFTLKTLAAAPHPAIVAQLEQQMYLVLANDDGIRSARTRRLTVDLLKQRQTTSAYQRLSLARSRINEQIELGMLSGDALWEARDLRARIDRAIAPYFD